MDRQVRGLYVTLSGEGETGFKAFEVGGCPGCRDNVARPSGGILDGAHTNSGDQVFLHGCKGTHSPNTSWIWNLLGVGL